MLGSSVRPAASDLVPPPITPVFEQFDLPKDVLALIFSFLSFEDQLRVSSVCHGWRKVMAANKQFSKTRHERISQHKFRLLLQNLNRMSNNTYRKEKTHSRKLLQDLRSKTTRREN